MKELINGIDSGEFPNTISWSRPVDWLALPTLTDADHKFVGLHAVYPDANFVALSAAGNYTVNWGDGVTENFNSGVTAYHAYDYNDADLTGTECSRGYKQAIVTVTPQAGQSFTSLNLQIKHNQSGLEAYSSGFLDIAVAGANLTSLTIGGTTIRFADLEQTKIYANSVTNFSSMFNNCYSLQSIPALSTGNGTNFSSMFNNCYSLQSIPALSTGNGTNFSSMFNTCYSLQSIPALSTGNGTNFSSMFTSCPSLQSIPALSTGNGTNFSSMFTGCNSLQSIPALSTGNGTNFSSMFTSCHSLQSIPALSTGNGTNFSSMFSFCRSLQSIPALSTGNGTNFSSMFTGCNSLQSIPALSTGNGTNFSSMFNTCYSLQSIPALSTGNGTNFSSMFNSCNSLQSIPALSMTSATSSSSYTDMFLGCNQLSKIEATGIKYTFSVNACKLSAARLNEIYTNLPTVSGQTITVTNNYGVTGDDPSIATSKGWTVVG